MYLHTATVNVCDFRLYLDEQILQKIELQNRKLLDKYLQFEISFMIFYLSLTQSSCLSPSLINLFPYLFKVSLLLVSSFLLLAFLFS